MNLKYFSKLADSFQIVLGSKSPRRVKLMRETGVPFVQIIPELEEEQFPGEPPYNFAERLARDKALSLLDRLESGQIVIACDTIVVLAGEVLGKPVDGEDAFRILSRLSGRRHVVCTALAIAGKQGLMSSGYELTEVLFNSVSPEQIREYIDSGEPMDKAGAYGIQGMGAFLVDSIQGNLDTVIGLPRVLLNDLSRQAMQDSP